MKFENVKAWKLAGKVAAVAALGAMASAQTSQSSAGDLGARKGQALVEVSMENDIHTPWDRARGKIVLQRPAPQLPLELQFKIRPRPGVDLHAFMPSMDDMEMTVMLVNGTPGGMAAIHLDTRAPELRRAGGTRIVGFFDEDGRFSAELPRGYQGDGIIARGEEVTLANLHASAGGGRAVPASKRPTTDDMEVEEVVTTAYHNWARWYAEVYTNLQFKLGGMRSARLDDRDSADSTTMSFSSSGLALGGGHVQQGSGVDNDTDIGEEPVEVFPDLPNPVGGSRAFGKIALQRPARPVLGGGHTLPGSGVDDNTDIGDGQGAVVDLPDPVGGQRAFGKIKLQRPRQPAQRDDHDLQRKL